jgi:sugar-phosphate isomerases, RpiB/LacA/LacB family
MKIIIGSDHRGYAYKELIKKHFGAIAWTDVGTDNGTTRVDYPLFTEQVCEAILNGQFERGILICGSGVGVSIAANRFSGIFAALCWTPDVARIAREHDCANVLALSADFVMPEVTFQIVTAWLESKFAGGVYQRRLDLMHK